MAYGGMSAARPAFGGGKLQNPNIKFAPMGQGGMVVDPNEIARREAMAQALQEQASGIQDIEHPMQGFAQMANALVGGLIAKKAAKEKAGNNELLAEALGGYTQGNLSPEMMAQVMELNPELGLQLHQATMQQEAQERDRAAREEQMRWERYDDPARQLALEQAELARKQAELDYEQDLNPGPAEMDLPADMMPDPNTPGGVTPIPGSNADYERQQDAAKAEAEAAKEQAAAQKATELEEFKLKSVNDAIDRAQTLVGPESAGNIMGTGAAAMVPFVGQRSADLAAEIRTIEAFLGLENLMQMKAASPNGASGLGAVTLPELQFLVSQVGSLAQTQDHAVLAAKLKYIKDRLKEWGVGSSGGQLPEPDENGVITLPNGNTIQQVE